LRLHEVFAVQCEGEKLWTIYENRAASRVEPLEGEIGLHGLSAASEWLLGRPAFSIQELHARFRWVDEAEIRALVGSLERLGLLFPYTPAL
jgi:hypothetical protein